MAEHPLGVRPWGNSLLAERKDVRAEGVMTSHRRSATQQADRCPFAGLGLLSHLCDEVVLDLLSALPAASLASIACCSKALYCFCGHEELWKALVLNVSMVTVAHSSILGSVHDQGVSVPGAG